MLMLAHAPHGIIHVTLCTLTLMRMEFCVRTYLHTRTRQISFVQCKVKMLTLFGWMLFTASYAAKRTAGYVVVAYMCHALHSCLLVTIQQGPMAVPVLGGEGRGDIARRGHASRRRRT